MRQGAARRFPLAAGYREVCVIAGLLGSVLAVPAVGQDVAGSEAAFDQLPRSNARVCNVVARPAPGEGQQEVHALCWGTGLVLGAADSFTFSASVELEATVVELELDGEARVMLVRPDKTGNPLIEDFTGTLAASAGRAPWQGLAGLGVDFSQFGVEGAVGVMGEPEGELVAGRGAAGKASGGTQVSVAQHIARDVERGSLIGAVSQ